MAIHVKLDAAIKKKGMTAKALSELVGITEANISLLRTGSVKGIRFDTLNKICYYLECNVLDILDFDGRLDETNENSKENE